MLTPWFDSAKCLTRENDESHRLLLLPGQTVCYVKGKGSADTSQSKKRGNKQLIPLGCVPPGLARPREHCFLLGELSVHTIHHGATTVSYQAILIWS